MPKTTDTRAQRRTAAIRSAFISGFWLLLSAGIMLVLRARFAPDRIGSVILAAAAILNAALLIPLVFTAKERLKEIEGGEEDEARNY